MPLPLLGATAIIGGTGLVGKGASEYSQDNEDINSFIEAMNEPTGETAQMLDVLKNDKPASREFGLAEADYYSALNQEINGEDAETITNQEELDQIRKEEAYRILAENETALSNKNLAEVIIGNNDTLELQRAALQSATERNWTEINGSSAGLEASNARQHQAEALVSEQNLQTVELAKSQRMASMQSKYSMIVSRQKMWSEKAGNSSVWQGIKDIAYFSLPKSSETNMRLASLSGFDDKTPEYDQAAMAKRIRDMWTGAIMNPDISVMEMDRAIKEYEIFLKKNGMSDNEIAEAFSNMLDPHTVMAKISMVGDYIPFAPTLGGAAKGLYKGALRGLAKSAGKGYLKGALTTTWHTTAGGISGFTFGSYDGIIGDPFKSVASSNPTGAVLGKIGDDIFHSLGRKKFFGSSKEAAEEVAAIAKEIGDIASKDKNFGVLKNMSQNLGDGVYKIKTVFEDVIGQAAAPTEAVIDSLANSAPILRERGVRAMFSAIKDMLDNTPYTFDKLVMDAHRDIFDATAKALNENKTYRSLGLGDLVKAIPDSKDPMSQIVGVPSGNVVARVRLNNEFDTLGEATHFLKKFSKDQDMRGVVLMDTNGKYRIDLDIDTRKGLSTVYHGEGDLGWKPRSLVSGLFTLTSNSKDMRELIGLQEMNDSLIRSIGKNSLDKIKALNKDEGVLLDNILTRSIDDRAWYTPEKLIAEGYDTKLVDAYSSIRNLSDVSFYMKNSAERAKLSQVGIKAIQVDGKDFGWGRVVRNAGNSEVLSSITDNKKRVVINDVMSKPMYYKDLDRVSQLMIESSLKDGSFVLLEKTHSVRRNFAASNVYYIMRPNRIIENPLPDIVMNYLPGWRRYFDRDALFVKQMKLDDYGDISGVSTFFADTNKELMIQRCKDFEEIRKAVAQRKSDIEVTQLIQSKGILGAPFKNSEEFKKWASSMHIDIRHEANALEVVQQGQPLTSYDLLKKSFRDGLGPDIAKLHFQQSPYDAMTAEVGYLAQARKEGVLLDSGFNPVKIVDVEKNLQYMVDDMVNYGVMQYFDEFYGNRFYESFADIAYSEGAKAAPMYSGIEMLHRPELFKNALKSADPSEKAKADAAITAIKNYQAIKGIPSVLETRMGELCYNTFLKIGKMAGKILPETEYFNTIRTKTRVNFDKLVEAKPLSFQRTMAAHYYLGCLNPGQWIKNFAGPAWNMLQLEPIYGAEAAKYLYAVKHNLAGFKGNRVLAEAMFKDIGINSSKVDILTKNLMSLGIMEETYKGGAITGMVPSNSVIDKMSKTSMFFFRDSDIANRVLTYITAALKNGYGDKVLTDIRDIKRIRSYGDSLYMNMSKTGMSRAQVGEVGKTAFQFLGYRLRAIETLMDENLTLKQRATLLTGIIAASGMEGFLGFNAWNAISSNLPGELNNTIDSEGDEGWEKDMRKIISNGIFDWAVEYCGSDMKLSSLFNLDAADFVNDVLEISPKNFITNAASVKAMAKPAEALLTAIRWTSANIMTGNKQSYSDLLQHLATRKTLPSGPNNALLWYGLVKKGALYNTRGELTSKDTSALNQIAVLMGIPSQSSSKVWLIQELLKKEKNSVAEVVKALETYYREASIANQADSTATLELIKNTIEAANLTDQQRQSVIEGLNKKITDLGDIPLIDKMMREYVKKHTYNMIEEN